MKQKIDNRAKYAAVALMHIITKKKKGYSQFKLDELNWWIARAGGTVDISRTTQFRAVNDLADLGILRRAEGNKYWFTRHSFRNYLKNVGGTMPETAAMFSEVIGG